MTATKADSTIPEQVRARSKSAAAMTAHGILSDYVLLVAVEHRRQTQEQAEVG